MAFESEGVWRSASRMPRLASSIPAAPTARRQFTPIGTFLLNIVLTLMEWFWLAPKGSGKVREMLRQAQLGLVAGGKGGYFTPMYFVFARKPSKPSK